MEMKVMAFDDGYGDNKLKGNGKPILIPSFITDFKPMPEEEFQKNKELIYYASSIEGKDYVVGDYAIRLDPHCQWRGGENKHADNKFPLIFKSCLGLMSDKETDNIHKLVMGLPVNSNTEERQSLLRSIVEGKHEVELSFDGEMFFKRNIYVEELVVKPQPFGSLCDLILNDQGQLVNKDMAKGFNVVVDIGARTVNILTVEGLNNIEELTTHTNNGLYTSYLEVGKYLKEKTGSTIPDGKLPSIIQSKTLNGYDLTNIINLSQENLAYNIKNVIDKLFIDSKGLISNLIFTGGGSEVLKPYLEKMYPNKNTVFLNRFSTVKGLRKYGIRKAVQDHDIQVKVGDYDRH